MQEISIELFKPLDSTVYKKNKKGWRSRKGKRYGTFPIPPQNSLYGYGYLRLTANAAISIPIIKPAPTTVPILPN